jgi:hypothetical protein
MGLASRLSAPPADPAKQFCTVGRTLDNLLAATNEMTDDPTSDYAALVGSMVTGAWSSTDLVRALHAEGYTDVTVRHMREHRNGSHTVDQCKRPLVGHIR